MLYCGGSSTIKRVQTDTHCTIISETTLVDITGCY